MGYANIGSVNRGKDSKMGTKEHNSQECRKLNCIECMRELSEPIIEQCLKVQFSVKDGSKSGEFKTEIIDKPCTRIDGDVCGACMSPTSKWRLEKCNLATHLYHENKQGQPYAFITPIGKPIVDPRVADAKLNPIKYSKRL